MRRRLFARFAVRVSTLTAVSVGATIESIAHAQPPVGGAEFVVNDYTSYRQDRPDVAIDDSGSFIVVWTSELQDESLDGVFGRRYDAAGAPQAAEFQINLATEGNQNEAAVARDADGDFVVVWRSGADAASGDIFARRFDSAGVAQGGAFQVNTYTPELQHVPAVAMDGDGDFVVAWTSQRQDGSTTEIEGRNGGLFAQRFDSAGVAQGAEFQINTYTEKGQHDPTIAMRADGFFVVTWSSREQDEDSSSGSTHDGVFAQLFSSTGAPLGVEFQVNTYTMSYQHHQAIGMDAEGDFVVVWHSGQYPGANSDIFGQRFTSAGAPVGGEFQVNSFTDSYQEDTAIAVEEDGDFVVVWDSKTADGDAYGVFGKRFDSAGTALSADFQINAFTAGYQNRPAATRSAGGVFVVAWQSGAAQDGYDYGVFAKRFGAGTPGGPVLDVDGDGTVEPLTDGLLVLRWAFGFTGAALVNNATDPDCERCTGEQVVAWLDPLEAQLDIDDDEATLALTDGLLVLRFLFGFTGNSLIGGAVGEDCDRCDATEIEDYLGTLDG